MTGLSPTSRLEWIAKESRLSAAHKSAGKILELYGKFLEQIGDKEEQLLTKFRDDDNSRTMFEQADALGNEIFELLAAIGTGAPLYRHLVV